MGLLQVALKPLWSVVLSYSDSLGKCFFKSFVGICSSAGFEELHPRSIRRSDSQCLAATAAPLPERSMHKVLSFHVVMFSCWKNAEKRGRQNSLDKETC